MLQWRPVSKILPDAMTQYIWQTPEWPHLVWNPEPVIKALGLARLHQGKLLAKSTLLSDQGRQHVWTESLEEEIVRSSAIEGELLDRQSVRSSLFRALGIPMQDKMLSSHHTDGVVEVLLDAVQNYDRQLSAELLFSWHRALFPSGQSGLSTIRTGSFRNSPMEVVSGPYGKRTVHFEAPPAELVQPMMTQFLDWFNASRGRIDGLLRAAIAHLTFVTIHPFDDGNGRLARTITELALSQDEHCAIRLYSLSSQILSDRKTYYECLEQTQKGIGDITSWLVWFLSTYRDALADSEVRFDRIVAKTRFWNAHRDASVSPAQQKVLNRLLDGFEGNLTTRKYVGISGVSRATAWREIHDLVTKGLLEALPGSGKRTAYRIPPAGSEPSAEQK